jgi:predicted transposase YbfD/YdcC
MTIGMTVQASPVGGFRSGNSDSILEHFSELEDPRVDRTKDHSLESILVISLMAMVCGAESFTEMEEFGEAKKDWLGSLLSLPNGIPSHDTFNRVYSALDPKKFSECFMKWVESIRKKIEREIVSGDGKTARRTKGKNKPVPLVSAWARENGLALGMVKVDEKSNEITAIPELLRELELSGCIVTIDAMGTQKAIATEICNADADYVLALKGNQEKVHKDVKTYFEDKALLQEIVKNGGYREDVEKDHGRLEVRRYYQTEQIGWLPEARLWEGLKSIGMVESERTVEGKTSIERRHYLTSLKMNIHEFARAVRGHWGVENP